MGYAPGIFVQGPGGTLRGSSVRGGLFNKVYLMSGLHVAGSHNLEGNWI